jgi:hypothetical protein
MGIASASKRFDFDIWNFSPERQEGKEFDQLDESIQRLYLHINFMVYLLWDLPYSVVHGSVRELALGMKANLEHEDWPQSEYYKKAQEIAPRYLDRISELHASHRGVTVTDLFRSDSRGYPGTSLVPPSATDESRDAYNIVSLSNELKQALWTGTPRVDICLPFIAIQGEVRNPPPEPPPPPRTFVSESDLAKYGPRISHLTLKDLYIKPLTTYQKAAVTAFSSNGVLRPTTQTSGARIEVHLETEDQIQTGG